jgi:hypothetical protein
MQFYYTAKLTIAIANIESQLLKPWRSFVSLPWNGFPRVLTLGSILLDKNMRLRAMHSFLLKNWIKYVAAVSHANHPLIGLWKSASRGTVYTYSKVQESQLREKVSWNQW